MKPAENIKNLIKNLQYKTTRETHNRILNNLQKTLAESQKTKPATQTNIWRIIMKSKITKLAAAAVIIVAVGLTLFLLDLSTTPAYAIEQTIKAHHSVRYLHIKDFKAGENEPKQFWVEFDNDGQVKNIRLDFPKWAGGGDGAKVVVWKENKAQIWFKKKKSFVTVWDKTVAAQFLKMIEELDPKRAVERLYEREKQGKVKIEIDEPSDKTEPIVVTATYLPESSTPGKQGVLFVNQATKLVTAIEFYQLKDGEYKYSGRMEFYDYNKPIDARMFVLDSEIPPDAMRVDQTTQDVGLLQEQLGDKEIAIEVVRQFFQALIAKDYAKAGRLFGGIPASKIQEIFAEFDVVRIISISEPIPYPIPGVGGFKVPCKIEIERDGVKSVEPYGLAVRPVYGQPERWNIHGGI